MLLHPVVQQEIGHKVQRRFTDHKDAHHQVLAAAEDRFIQQCKNTDRQGYGGKDQHDPPPVHVNAPLIKGILDLQESAEDQREAPDFRENVSHVRRAGNQQNAGQQQHKPQCHVRPGQAFPDICPQIADQQPSARQNQSGCQGPRCYMGHCFIQQDQEQTDDEIK